MTSRLHFLRTVLIYSASLAALVILLKMIAYRFLVHDLSLEFYIGTVAVFFTGLGIWAGLRLTSRKTIVRGPEFVMNQEEVGRLGISQREMEVLQLMAQGLSNQEIGDRLFVSLNTIKSHTSSLFVKLDVRRRTQAIQKAREMALVP